MTSNADEHPARDDWRPTASWPALRRRAALLAKLRGFFERHGFLEVETPILSADTVVDRHLDPFPVPLAVPGAKTRLWLQTSPEFAMKRLMAAGAEAIYQVTRAFRRHEQGARHNPEFTLVEWYRRGDSMAEGMQFLSALCAELLGMPPAKPLTYRAAFQEHLGLDPHSATVEELAAAARRHNVAAPQSLGHEDRDSWLDLLLVSLVEPHLGKRAPVILHDYPASQAVLAQLRAGDPPVAERFELYVQGIELANGYHELADPDAIRARIRTSNAARQADRKETLPEESRLLAAMQHGLPACTGAALGFDRLVMLAVGASSLSEVIAFPWDRA
jgi:lysyl-tRNA synthetase class 2